MRGHAFICFFRRVVSGRLFAGNDSTAGANLSAAAALDASVGIDVVDVTFRDSLNGANGHTCATSHARISNNVSHDDC